MTRFRVFRLAIWLGCFGLISAGSPAQNALDRGQPNAPLQPQRGGRVTPPGAIPGASLIPGRALDANPLVGSGGLNTPVPGFSQELAFRNAIVTGNVGGGRAFRGDVGYGAADDFRGETGSDDLFAFQRDSAYSGLATQGIRGITPLQFQLTESTAGQTQGVLGELIIRRSSSGYSSGAAAGNDPASALTVDPYGNLRGSLRSTSEFLLRNARFPRILGGLGKTEEGAEQLYMTANPLIGVKAITLGNPIFSIQERPDLMLPKEKQEEAPDRPGLAPELLNPAVDARSPFESLRENLQLRSTKFIASKFGEPPADEPKPEATPETQKPAPSIVEKYDRMIEEFRESFRKKYLEDTAPKEGEKPRDSSGLIPGSERKTGGGEGASPEDANAPDQAELIERARALLDNGESRLQTFLQKHGADDLYSWHMEKGQEALITDRWFEAEERFTAALRAKPGDPMAAAARVHAQLGGSLFRSAGMNLRNLLSAYPELIAARFAADLLPKSQRLEGVRFTLRERLKADSPFARDAAFLLAYVGWQIGNERDIFDGFAALDRFHTEAKDEADSLERVVRGVWSK